MAISITIKDNSKQIDKNFKSIVSKFPRIIDQGIKQAGFQLLEFIKTKTKRGIDFNDKPFAPYSERYLKQLSEEGKPTNVDLFYSGRMLGSLTPDSFKKTGKHKITLVFSRAEERTKALFNQVLRNPIREFFGFNTKTENIIKKQFHKFISQEINKI